MSNYKTANLKPDTMERLRDFAVGDESIDSAVKRLLDEIDQDAGGLSETDAREIIGRIDDLESQLPRKVAQEVRS